MTSKSVSGSCKDAELGIVSLALIPSGAGDSCQLHPRLTYLLLDTTQRSPNIDTIAACG